MLLQLFQRRAYFHEMQYDRFAKALDHTGGAHRIEQQRAAAGAELDDAHVLGRAHLPPHRRHPQSDQLAEHLADLGRGDEIPGGPTIVVANEFIDALPVHQAIRQADGWHERVVEIGADGKLCFGVAHDTLPHFETSLPRALRGSPAGSIFEWRDDRVALDLGRRVRGEGAVLILDYGHVNYGLGDTLQAVAGHAYVDPLQSPGEADLTAHVDFEALAQSAESIGGRIHGPILQRDFLLRLGIKQRAATLKANASRDMALEIELALSRLTASGAQGMGELFKALAIADPKLGALPGFEAP